mmetsp:Transcript_2837/g.6618  ORF Transcript_2837/g.6618 Transcript_2837/m.6618 type:complete len:213 (+) Transcript_2837:409-1047(+)
MCKTSATSRAKSPRCRRCLLTRSSSTQANLTVKSSGMLASIASTATRSSRPTTTAALWPPPRGTSSLSSPATSPGGLLMFSPGDLSSGLSTVPTSCGPLATTRLICSSLPSVASSVAFCSSLERTLPSLKPSTPAAPWSLVTVLPTRLVRRSPNSLVTRRTWYTSCPTVRMTLRRRSPPGSGSGLPSSGMMPVHRRPVLSSWALLSLLSLLS